MPLVYVSIGSNVDRDRNINAALDALEQRFGPLAVSSLYESRAVGFAGGDFYNLVVGFATKEKPMAVIRILKAMEDRQGRVRGGPRFADRTLDLDLILYGDLISAQGELDLPRHEILENAFVLIPLAEIAGDKRHPVNGKSYRELWNGFAALGHDIRPVAFERAGP